MTAADLIHRWFDEVWCQGNEATIDEMWHPELLVHGATDAPMDLHAFKGFWRTLRSKFPDMQVTIDEVVDGGDQVAVRCTSRFVDPKTGQEVVLKGATFARVEGGRFVQVTDTWDYLATLESLGILPQGTLVQALM